MNSPQPVRTGFFAWLWRRPQRQFLLGIPAGAAVAFIAGIVPMIIDGIGLSGHDDHSQKETADLRMLPVLTKRAALLLHRLTQGERAQP